MKFLKVNVDLGVYTKIFITLFYRDSFLIVFYLPIENKEVIWVSSHFSFYSAFCKKVSAFRNKKSFSKPFVSGTELWCCCLL